MPPNLAQSSLNSLKVGVLVLDGADNPVLANPAAGRYTVVVNGFAVVGKDQFTLRALADGRVLDAAR